MKDTFVYRLALFLSDAMDITTSCLDLHQSEFFVCCNSMRAPLVREKEQEWATRSTTTCPPVLLPTTTTGSAQPISCAPAEPFSAMRCDQNLPALAMEKHV